MFARALPLLGAVLAAPSCDDGLATAPATAPTAAPHRIITGATPSGGITLGGSGTSILAMNAAGQAAGQSNLPGDLATHAFRWSPGGGIQDLGTLGGVDTHSHARGLNAAGDVVGYSTFDASGIPHAFRWTPEAGMQDLGTLGGQSSFAEAISNGGAVIGYSQIAAGFDAPAHAFRWTPDGGMQDLGTLGGVSSFAYWISADGRIVAGRSHTSGNLTIQPFVWTREGGMQVLSLGGAYGEITAMNAAGQVVGYATTAGDAESHAFVWTPGNGIQDLGTLGGAHSEAHAINDAGQVAGASDRADNSSHAFLWTPGQGMRDLGTLGGSSSVVRGINAAGQAVGTSTTASTFERHAFLWTPEDGMEDLYPSTGFAAAFGISDNGYVRGRSDRGVDGVTQVRLTPNRAPVAAPLAVSTASGTPVGVTLAGNDPEGGALAYAITTQPQHGTLSGTAPALTYAPAAGYTGPDAFAYTATDPKGLVSPAAAVSIAVRPATNTPAGSGVAVTPVDAATGLPAPVVISFGTVTAGGTTTVTSGPVGGGGPPAPDGFRLGTPPVAYEIRTTATFAGTATVCVTYAEGQFANEAQLRLLHRDAATGRWDDVTTSRDPAANVVCGVAASFSPFLVAENVAPIVTRVVLPAGPVPVNTAVSATAAFTDAPDQSYAGQFDWEGTTSAAARVTAPALGVGGAVTPGEIAGTRTYAQPGVYTVTAAVSDGSLSGSRASTLDQPAYVVVYDPSAGFVTGGGWITSPAGACDPAACASTGEGKATFGFVSKYAAGAQRPGGTTEFEFRAGGFRFASTSYDWLVVAGARAQYKGTGVVNGGGSYAFLLTAVDGQVSGGGGVDRFRIKVWNKTTGAVVYDNQRGQAEDSDAATALGGGGIVVHK